MSKPEPVPGGQYHNNSVKKSTELIRVDRLKEQIGTEIQVVDKTYYLYEQGVWKTRTRNLMRPLALRTLDPEDRTTNAVRAILDLAEDRWQVAASTFKGCIIFDTNGNVLINTLDSVLKVTPTTIEELPHSHEYYFTRQLQVVYTPGVDFPHYRKALQEGLPCEQDQKLKQLMMANIFYPSAKFEVALVEVGAAGSGKSTLAEPFLNMFGDKLKNAPRVVSHLTIIQLCDSRTYGLAELESSLVNHAAELQSLEVADSSNFKTLVSGEPIQVRDIYEKSQVIRPTCKLWFLSNTMPRFKHGTAAELRRLRFLFYQHVASEEQFDSTLKQTLTQERDAIFSGWVLPALQELLTMNRMPLGGKASTDQMERFATSNDPLASFVTGQCVFEKDAFIPTHRMINALQEHYRELDLPASFGNNPLKPFLERYPFIKQGRFRAQDNVRGLVGVRLKTEEELKKSLPS